MLHSDAMFTGAGGLSLYEQRWEPPGTSSAAIALIHGYGEHGGRYRPLIRYLLEQHYAVHSFDLRGHGRSSGQRGHIMSWLEYRTDLGLFLALVKERSAGLPVFLYGHSLGGLIVLDYALQYPDGLCGVIASAPLLAQPAISPVLIQVSKLLSKLRPTFALNTRPDAATLSRDTAVVNAYREDILVHGMASARMGTELSAAMARTIEGAPQWRVPLLLLFGDADRLVPPDGARRFFERVQSPEKALIVYSGGYHEPHNDINQAQVQEDIGSWLARSLGAVRTS